MVSTSKHSLKTPQNPSLLQSVDGIRVPRLELRHDSLRRPLLFQRGLHPNVAVVTIDRIVAETEWKDNEN